MQLVIVFPTLKVIKFHVWEECFEKDTTELRNLELDALKEFLVLQVGENSVLSEAKP